MTYSHPTTNRAQAQTLHWIERQIAAGFSPTWFLSAHFRSSTETGSHRAGSTDVSAHAIRQYISTERKRNDLEQINKDTRDASNKLQRVLWGTPRGSGRKYRANAAPTLWVVEKGISQYHVHILIPDPSSVNATAAAIDRAWRQQLVPNCRCLSSSAQSIKVVPINDLTGLLGYITKQVTDTYPAIDYLASTLPATPASALRPPRQRSGRSISCASHPHC
jgi:hypothetical protein